MEQELEGGERFGGRFRLLERLAGEGPGDAFLAYDEGRGHRCVLRALPFVDPRGPGSRALENEFAILAALRHPSLERTPDGGVWFYTREHVPLRRRALPPPP